MPGNFICHRCKVGFRDNEQRDRHLNRKNPCVPFGTIVIKPQWTCGPCKQPFSWKGGYKVHLKSILHKRMVVSYNENQEELFEARIDIGSRCSDVPGYQLSNIRKTNEVPPRVAIYDLIMVVTGYEFKQSSVIFNSLCSSNIEINMLCDERKGHNQSEIPLTGAEGALNIINLLPSKRAAKFRLECAEMFLTNIGGDLTLTRSIVRDRVIAEPVSEEDPLQFVGQSADPPVLPDSVTGIQNELEAQFYAGYAGPPSSWANLKRSDGAPFVLRDDQNIFKFGKHEFGTDRSITHTRAFGVWQVIDSVLTKNPARLEKIMKDEMRSQLELLSGLHCNKTTRDTELFAANTAEFTAIILRAVGIAEKLVRIDLEMEREITKRQEAESRARIAEANVRLLELQMKMTQSRA